MIFYAARTNILPKALLLFSNEPHRRVSWNPYTNDLDIRFDDTPTARKLCTIYNLEMLVPFLEIKCGTTSKCEVVSDGTSVTIRLLETKGEKE